MGAWPIYGLYMGAWQGSRAAGYRVPDPQTPRRCQPWSDQRPSLAVCIVYTKFSYYRIRYMNTYNRTRTAARTSMRQVRPCTRLYELVLAKFSIQLYAYTALYLGRYSDIEVVLLQWMDTKLFFGSLHPSLKQNESKGVAKRPDNQSHQFNSKWVE